MKQFELKFYREWFDALSELSHEERANAVLALLEYVYENKLPEDKFIRIVTTLMRNKIDREKAAHDRAIERKEQKEAVVNNNDSALPGEKTDPTSDSQNQAKETSSPYLTQEEIDKYSVKPEYVKEINTIISLRSNPDDPNFVKLSNNNNINPIIWAMGLKRLMIDMFVRGDLEPFKLPEDSKRVYFRQLRTKALKTISQQI